MRRWLISGRFYSQQHRVAVIVDPHLVEVAKGELASLGGNEEYAREIAVGCYICAFLIGGFLGIGAAWLYTGRRTPRIGERVKAVREDGYYKTGDWGGIGQHGDFKIGNKWLDSNDLAIVGPEIIRKKESYVDLSHGWIKPTSLAKLKAAHNREGYRRRRRRK